MKTFKGIIKPKDESSWKEVRVLLTGYLFGKEYSPWGCLAFRSAEDARSYKAENTLCADFTMMKLN